MTSSSSFPPDEAGDSPQIAQTSNPSPDESSIPAAKSTPVQDTPEYVPANVPSVTSATDEVEDVLPRSITPQGTLLKSMISVTVTEIPSTEGTFEINVSSLVTADEKNAEWSATEDRTPDTEIIYTDRTTADEDLLRTTYVKSEIVEGNEEIELSPEDLKGNKVNQDKIQQDVAALSF